MPAEQAGSGPGSVSVVVVSYGSAAFLAQCLQSLFENIAAYDGPVKAGVIENRVDPATIQATGRVCQPYLAQGLQYLPAPRNLGYGGAANLGWRQLGHSAVNIVLNPDMSFPPGWLARFVAPFERDPAIGISGCKLVFGDGRIQHAGGLLEAGTALGYHFGYGEPDDGRFDQSGEVDFVTGAALGLRHAALERLDGFEPSYFPGYYEDVDLCWRARQSGYKVWYEAGAVAFHYEGTTFGREAGYYRATHRNRLRFVLRNYTTAGLLYQFVPAERARLLHPLAPPDRLASAAVYRVAARFFGSAVNDFSGLKDKTGARDMSPQTPGPPYTNSFYRPEPEEMPEEESELIERLQGHTAAVKKQWLVEEKPFRSRWPLVASLRERFNSISTRWYIKPILAQQVEFNAAVARAVEDLGNMSAGNLTATNLQTSIMSARLLALENRLERIETLLERLAATPVGEVAGEDGL